jgi:hypothetical protein
MSKRIGYEVGIGAGHGVNKFEKACGKGSYPQYNKRYCNALKGQLKEHKITSVSDYGCGNMESYRDNINWEKLGIDYKGYDVHLGCIEECKKRYPNLKFNTVELMELPPPDQCLIIKDVLIHWFDHHIEEFFEKVFDSFDYVFYMHSTTNQGYKTRDKRHSPHPGYGIEEPDPEYFYGYKCVPQRLLPNNRIIHKQNIPADSTKTFMVFK